jgi:peptidoglycan/xylan/chitin deacetylase (PgdA/CDA1 family)
MKSLLAACALLSMVMQAQALVILQYHHISDSTPTATSTSPALFARHLDIIAQAGFTVVDLASVARLLRTDTALPDRTVLITFDDSYPSIYATAFPLLKARAWPFVIFANTEPVDSARPGFLSWAELEEMATNGAAIANHTHRHLHLVRRPEGTAAAPWREQVEREIRHAEARIHAQVGQMHRVLAFPYGEYDRDLLALLEDLDYLGMSQNSGAARRGQGLALPRFPLGGRYGEAEDFRLKLHALPLPVEELEILDEQERRLTDNLLPAGVSRPLVELRLADPTLATALQCYASGQTEAIEKTAHADRLRFQTGTPLPAGRSRYNCTARDAASGRYHWYSIPFLRRRDDGAWPREP